MRLSLLELSFVFVHGESDYFRVDFAGWSADTDHVGDLFLVLFQARLVVSG